MYQSESGRIALLLLSLRFLGNGCLRRFELIPFYVSVYSIWKRTLHDGDFFLTLLLPPGVATVTILISPLLLCVIYYVLLPRHRPLNLLLSKRRHGICNVGNGLSASCTHYGVTHTDESARVLNRRTRKVPDTAAIRSRILATGFKLQSSQQL